MITEEEINEINSIIDKKWKEQTPLEHLRLAELINKWWKGEKR